jgi:hypothetical protein
MVDEATDGGADGGAAKHDAGLAALDRVSSKLERLSAQRKALRQAIRQFGDDFDLKVWSDAFASPDSEDINRVFAVTGGYLALVNNTAEAVKIGSKLAGVKPTDGILGIAGSIDAIRLEDGFSDQQAETFVELYRTRNRLQHSSPDVEADEIHRQVLLLLRHLPRFVKSYVAWLQKHGIEL